jgi:hypothetical protein
MRARPAIFSPEEIGNSLGNGARRTNGLTGDADAEHSVEPKS